MNESVVHMPIFTKTNGGLDKLSLDIHSSWSTHSTLCKTATYIKINQVNSCPVFA